MKQDTIEPADIKQVNNPAWGQTPYQRVDVDRYISPEHVALERERLWPNAWQMACREDEIPNPGDYHEYEICDQSLLVTRTKSGKIKAFFNSCLHRGTQLAKGCGHVSQFTCPFHGWRWSIDGENRYIHDQSDFPGLTADQLRLPEAQVGTWGGFVFVKLTEGGPSLEEHLGPMIELLAPYRLEEYRIKSWRTKIVGANWKTALEAFEESYHHMGTHPQALPGCCEVTGMYETCGPHSRMIIPTAISSAHLRHGIREEQILETAVANLLDVNLADETEKEMMLGLLGKPLPEGMTTRKLFQNMSKGTFSKVLPEIPEENYLDAWNCTLFPNLVFNQLPANFFGFRARPYGSDPDTCIFDVIALIHPCGQQMESEKRQWIDDPDHHWGSVLSQDFTNLPRVQQGMHARTTKQTRLASYQEQRVANRPKYIDQYYEQYANQPA